MKVLEIITFRPNAEDKLKLQAIAVVMDDSVSGKSGPMISHLLREAINEYWETLTKGEPLPVVSGLLREAAGKDKEMIGTANQMVRRLEAKNKEDVMDREDVVALLDQIAETVPATRETVNSLKKHPRFSGHRERGGVR